MDTHPPPPARTIHHPLPKKETVRGRTGDGVQVVKHVVRVAAKGATTITLAAQR
jgi:hypothetical protein